jgi:hypothetical protein
MKKIATLIFASLTFVVAKAQKIEGDNKFTSTMNQTISINDTVKIGLPVQGQQTYLFIENKKDKTIKKVGKTADNVSKISSLFGLGGLRGAVTGLRVGQAASNAHTAAEAADMVNGNGIIKPEQKLIIIKFYKGEDNTFFADAVNLKNNTFKIKIDQALMVKEIVAKDANIYAKEEQEDNRN